MTFQFLLKWAAIYIVLFSAIGCASSELKDFEHAQSSVKTNVISTGLSQPPVSVGDVFIFDNPSVSWEVIATSDRSIEWRDGQNGFMKTSLSTLFPKLRWQSEGDAGNRIIDITSGYLHPLKAGNKVTFIEQTVRARPGTTYQATWNCEVQEQVEIVVQAGKSMTWPVLCYVNGSEKVLFNYAENIGHVVRYIVANDDGSRYVRQLTGYKRGPTSPE